MTPTRHIAEQKVRRTSTDLKAKMGNGCNHKHVCVSTRVCSCDQAIRNELPTTWHILKESFVFNIDRLVHPQWPWTLDKPLSVELLSNKSLYWGSNLCVSYRQTEHGPCSLIIIIIIINAHTHFYFVMSQQCVFMHSRKRFLANISSCFPADK